MRASETLAPPVGYSEWWLLLGIGLLVLVTLFYGWVLWRTRRPRTSIPVSTVSRAATLAAIDDVAARVRAGALTPRAAHQELSAAVRAFAGASSRTLAELSVAGSPLAPMIADWYGPEFAADASGDPLRAAAAARDLVAAWR